MLATVIVSQILVSFCLGDRNLQILVVTIVSMTKINSTDANFNLCHRRLKTSVWK